MKSGWETCQKLEESKTFAESSGDSTSFSHRLSSLPKELLDLKLFHRFGDLISDTRRNIRSSELDVDVKFPSSQDFPKTEVSPSTVINTIYQNT